MSHTVSQNGWPVVHEADKDDQTRVWTIPGQSRDVRLRMLPAAPGFVMAHFVLNFDRFIEDVEQGADDWGWAERNIAGDTDISNHASATAVDLNALRHPRGARTTFTVAQQDAVGEMLERKYRNTIGAGMFWRNADDMHFEYVTGRLLVRELAGDLWDTPFGIKVREANPWLDWTP
jgi:hypothetical protein